MLGLVITLSTILKKFSLLFAFEIEREFSVDVLSLTNS